MVKTLSEKHKKFWALPKDKQRVAIAKDVLKLLDKQWIEPKSGEYGVLKFATIGQRPEKLDEAFMEAERCQVCALGACFISLVNLGDKVTVKEVEHTNYFLKPRQTDLDHMKYRIVLRKIFPPNQLSLIESAFETCWMSDGLDYDYALVSKAITYGRKLGNAETRMRAIMENIIANKGTFIP